MVLPSPATPPFMELQAPAAWRSVDFISDLHLQAGDAATFEAWRDYIQSTPADAVFILGDLFEVWVGDDAADPGFASGLRRGAEGGFRPQVVFSCRCTATYWSRVSYSRCGATLLTTQVLVFAGARWMPSMRAWPG